MAAAFGQLRIGEFARRVGVTPELLRAWETRYGFTRPVRSPGGFRLYTAADAARVKRMRRGLDEGLSAAEAARAALEDERPSEGLLEDAAARLFAAIGGYDEAAAHSVLDESLAVFGLEETLRHVVLPVLKAVGDGWKRGEIEISEEHFASNLIRGRLLALARFWGRGTGLLLFSPAHPVRCTTSLCSRSRSSCALTPGASSSSAQTRRSQRSPTRPRRQGRRARCRRELRPCPARGGSRRPPPAGPGGAARARRPCRNGGALRPSRRPPPGRGSRSGSRRSCADVTVSVSGPQRRLFLLTGATGYVGGRLLRVLEQRGERVRCLTGASRPSPLTRLDDDRERLQLALFIARFDAPVATAQ